MNHDVEEFIMLGSTSYVLQHLLGLKRVKSVINVDGIGYDHDSDGLLNVPYGEDSMKHVISEEYNRLGLDIDPVFLSIDALSQTEDPMPSDHLSFYLYGGVDRVVSFTGAFWISETENDINEVNVGYHTEEDTIDNINFNYMTEIVKLYVATLAREAGVIGRR
jgi:Zn-dependent M28 family amino/carboxypeptidase